MEKGHTRNIKLTMEYDGSRYAGWQKQAGRDRLVTIQGKVEEVLEKMEGKPVELIGAARTEPGVHAYGQVANFHTSSEKSVTEIKQYLNRYLPNDIAVLEAVEMPDRFHASYLAREFVYEYKVTVGEVPSVFERKYNYYSFKRVNVEKMKQAAVSKFGSGWAWLLADKDGKLSIVQTANQDVPDLEVYHPIFIVDVWEHAYYLQYQNRRADYVDGWFGLINWRKAEKRYQG